MRKLIAALLAAAALAVSAPAQSPPYPPSMPSRTVVGNMGPVAAPGSAVSLSVLQALILYGETPVSDANYSLVAADRTIAYTAISAARTVTLLPASSYPPGTQLYVFDRSGRASSTKTISVAPAGADLINGVNAADAVITAPYVIITLETDGVSHWTASAALSTTNAPFFALTQPSSGNFIGSGNPTTHQLVWSDTNPQFNADVMQFFSTDPSADAVLTLGGTPVAGDLYTLNFIYNSGTVSVFYTVQSGDTLAKVIAQLVCAVANNSTLFSLNGGTCSTTSGVVTPAANQSYGGYGSGNLIGYVVPIFSANQLAFDYNSNVSLQMSYSVSGSHSETVTFPSGFYKGPQFTGGTSGGSANAQTVTASGFTRSIGNSFTFTAGATNSGSATINVNSTGAVTVKKNVLGALINLVGGEIVTGTSYTVVDNGTNYVLNMNSATVAGGSTQSTNYTIPNALDNNPATIFGRIPGAPPAPGSVLGAWYATGPTSACASGRCANYGDIALYAGNSVAGSLQSAWIIQANGGNGSFQNGGGGVWIGQGVFSNSGGAPFNGGVIDEGPGTFNSGANGYYINNQYTLQQGSGQFTIATNNTDNLVLSGGVQIQFAPSAIGANGVIIQSNNIFPATDNQILLGASNKRWSAFHTMGANFYGGTSGSTLVQATGTASGTLTLPAATDTLIARATTDTLTNKTFDTAGAGNVFKINGTQVSAVTGTGSTAALSAGPTFTGTVTADTLTSNGAINGGGNLIITKSSGVLSNSLTATGSQVQVAYTGNSGVLYLFKDSNAGSNVKYFELLTGNGTTSLADLTDAGGAQHTYFTFTHSTGGTAMPGAIASTSSSTGTLTVTGGVGVSGAIYTGAEIATAVTTVSGLPTCNSAHKGARYFVTDATATTYHSTVAGSGSNNVGVTCDGSNWYISANDNLPAELRRKFA